MMFCLLHYTVIQRTTSDRHTCEQQQHMCTADRSCKNTIKMTLTPHTFIWLSGRAVHSSCSWNRPSSCCLSTIAQTMWFNEPSLRTMFFTVFSDKKLVHSCKNVALHFIPMQFCSCRLVLALLLSLCYHFFRPLG